MDQSAISCNQLDTDALINSKIPLVTIPLEGYIACIPVNDYQYSQGKSVKDCAFENRVNTISSISTMRSLLQHTLHTFRKPEFLILQSYMVSSLTSLQSYNWSR